MISIVIEVRHEAACFLARVRARDIRQAMDLARETYSGGETRVVFPINPEEFFGREPLSVVAGAVEVVAHEEEPAAAGVVPAPPRAAPGLEGHPPGDGRSSRTGGAGFVEGDRRTRTLCPVLERGGRA